MQKSNSNQANQSFVRYASSDTPWWQAQSADEIGPGIVRYSTASHGGYFLNKAANAKVPPSLKKSSFRGQGLSGWYEEDCDWAIVVYSFKDYFDAEHYAAAIKSLEQFHSEAWKRVQKSGKK